MLTLGFEQLSERDVAVGLNTVKVAHGRRCVEPSSPLNPLHDGLRLTSLYPFAFDGFAEPGDAVAGEAVKEAPCGKEAGLRAAGVLGDTTNHTFRATGITVYLENGGTIESSRGPRQHQDDPDLRPPRGTHHPRRDQPDTSVTTHQPDIRAPEKHAINRRSRFRCGSK